MRGHQNEEFFQTVFKQFYCHFGILVLCFFSLLIRHTSIPHMSRQRIPPFFLVYLHIDIFFPLDLLRKAPFFNLLSPTSHLPFQDDLIHPSHPVRGFPYHYPLHPVRSGCFRTIIHCIQSGGFPYHYPSWFCSITFLQSI